MVLMAHLLAYTPGFPQLICHIIAVGNVMKRLIRESDCYRSVPGGQILRAVTGISKVHSGLRAYTVDASLGGSAVVDLKLIKKAQKRVRDAKLVFTTCAGAGLGILCNFKFEVALIGEASQITEACVFIPLVKGCQRAVLVGDQLSIANLFTRFSLKVKLAINFQLRPTVRPRAKAVDFDRSLLERLYTRPDRPGMSRIMREVRQAGLTNQWPYR